MTELRAELRARRDRLTVAYSIAAGFSLGVAAAVYLFF